MQYLWIIMIGIVVAYLTIYSIVDWIRVCRKFPPGYRFDHLDDRTVAFSLFLIFCTFLVSLFMYIVEHQS